ncbi:MAG: Mu-like prophage major head subunit gpT family protein, partial [Lentisphaeria bacterium]|nr:Mu-like prophage major head subunit gpT family protein [Lentisphaeria bacterium]
MNITRDNLNSFFYAINANFNKGLGQVWPDFERFAVVLNSSTLMEKYPMTLMTGAMREWIGERVVHELTGKMVTVLNRDFEHTEGVSRNDLEDDTFGFFAP